jgi:hypothetical protein
MTPQLWIQFLTFQDWRLTHPDLNDEDAVLLYKAELQLFQNYQDEIRNQTVNRQVQLTGDLLNLSADISTILTEGGAGIAVRRYLLLNGSHANPVSGVAVGRVSDRRPKQQFFIRRGDEFIFSYSVPNDPIDDSNFGTYRALQDKLIAGTTGFIGNALVQFVSFQIDITNTTLYKKISDSIDTSSPSFRINTDDPNANDPFKGKSRIPGGQGVAA